MKVCYKIFLCSFEQNWRTGDVYHIIMELHQTNKRCEARDWITANTEFPQSSGYSYRSDCRAIVVYKYVDGVQQEGISLLRKANKEWPPKSKAKPQPVPQTT